MKIRLINLIKILILTLIINQKLNSGQPDFLILGAMKCGTTSLYNYLIQHPLIQPAKYKEVHFFDLNFHKGISWYKDRFPKKEQGKITGEASPFYLLHPWAPRRVYNTFPKVKLIILLCNPVKRAISHFFFAKNLMNLPYADQVLEEGLSKENERVLKNLKNMLEGKKHNIKLIRRFSYLTRGIYIEQIKRWETYFPRNQILYIVSEDLYKNTEQVVNKVFKFLGVHEFTLNKYEVFNKNTKKEKIDDKTIDWLYNFFKRPNQELEKYLNIKLPWKKK